MDYFYVIGIQLLKVLFSFKAKSPKALFSIVLESVLVHFFCAVLNL